MTEPLLSPPLLSEVSLVLFSAMKPPHGSLSLVCTPSFSDLLFRVHSGGQNSDPGVNSLS